LVETLALAALLVDKLGPMTRSVDDAMLVLNTISGPIRATYRACPANLLSMQDASVQG
jgi:Asp-tRNA(Asn)/Glu-tRNA(Gln) amidotransferase A subunit family amidase